jgi:hypothetical protein
VAAFPPNLNPAPNPVLTTGETSFDDNDDGDGAKKGFVAEEAAAVVAVVAVVVPPPCPLGDEVAEPKGLGFLLL